MKVYVPNYLIHAGRWIYKGYQEADGRESQIYPGFQCCRGRIETSFAKQQNRAVTRIPTNRPAA